MTAIRRARLLTTGRSFVPRWVVGGSRARKLAGIEDLADRMPDTRWVLLGDDGGHDPQVFVDFAAAAGTVFAVIGLRQVFDVGAGQDQYVVPGLGFRRCAAVVGAPNGEELLPLVRAALGIGQPREGSVADWFLSEFERGNGATRLAAWTEGNTVRPLVHGRMYYSALARELAAAGEGDSVQFVGWRGDADELLAEGGPTVVEALAGAARRGARVRGLLWRAHTGVVGSQAGPNRMLALAVNRAGGEVLLDQRVLPFGCHHQKMVLVRHRRPCPGRCGVPRRHRPRPRQPRRRRSPWRSAERGSRSRVRTQPRLPRRTAGAARSGGTGGGGDLSRAVAEPGGGVAAALARDS